MKKKYVLFVLMLIIFIIAIFLFLTKDSSITNKNKFYMIKYVDKNFPQLDENFDYNFSDYDNLKEEYFDSNIDTNSFLLSWLKGYRDKNYPIHGILRILHEKYKDLNADVKEKFKSFLLLPTNPESEFYIGDYEEYVDENEISLATPLTIAKLSLDVPKNYPFKDIIKEAYKTSFKKYLYLGLKYRPKYVFIYVTKMKKGDYGESYIDNDGNCTIYISSRINAKDLAGTVAHELMHCFQSDMGIVYDKEWEWLSEATAVWAENYVFPKLNTEHLYDKYIFSHLHTRFFSLSGLKEYGSYLFFVFLEQHNGLAKVVSVLKKSVKYNPRDVISGMSNYKFDFKEYALWNYNLYPFKFYNDYEDKPLYTPYRNSHYVSTLNRERNIEKTLTKGAMKYYSFDVPDRYEAIEIETESKDNLIFIVTIDGQDFILNLESNKEKICGVSYITAIAYNSDLYKNHKISFKLKPLKKCEADWVGIIKTHEEWYSHEKYESHIGVSDTYTFETYKELDDGLGVISIVGTVRGSGQSDYYDPGCGIHHTHVDEFEIGSVVMHKDPEKDYLNSRVDINSDGWFINTVWYGKEFYRLYKHRTYSDYEPCSPFEGLFYPVETKYPPDVVIFEFGGGQPNIKTKLEKKDKKTYVASGIKKGKSSVLTYDIRLYKVN